MALTIVRLVPLLATHWLLWLIGSGWPHEAAFASAAAVPFNQGITQGYCGTKASDEWKPLRASRLPPGFRQGADISRQPVIIRINVIADKSLATEFPDTDLLHKRIRDLMLTVQLIYRQPEMASKLWINLVVVAISVSDTDYQPDLDSSQILEKFSSSSEIIEGGKVDINMLLMFRNTWDLGFKDRPNQPRKILGLAWVGSFCRMSNKAPALILNFESLGSAYILAHELGHALNSMHDGDPNLSADCNPETDIMSPTNGFRKVRWSKCSVQQMYKYFTENEEANTCIFDSARMQDSRPVSPMFDFAPNRAVNTNLPGFETNIDAQCSDTLGPLAKSALTLYRSNGPDAYETCQNLVCALTDTVNINIGQAIPGSTCKFSSSVQLGICYNGFCAPK